MNSNSEYRRIRLQSLFPDRSPPPDAWQRLSVRLHAGRERRRLRPPVMLASASVLMMGIVIGLLSQTGREDLVLEGVTPDPGGSRLFIQTEEGRQLIPAERYADLTVYDLNTVTAATDPDGGNGESGRNDDR